jgi:hypothetical protein
MVEPDRERITIIQCPEHSGMVEAVNTLKQDRDVLFRKIDRLNATAFGLLIAIIVDVVLRLAAHIPK